jgi:hypothetical protein
MPFIGRASVTQEFVDRTSAMLLRQPEPQYAHAQLVKMALRAALAGADGNGLGLPIAGRDGIGQKGAPYGSFEEDKLMLDDPLFGEMIATPPEFAADLASGKLEGHSLRINRPIYADTTYTQASREVPNGTTISTTPIAASSEQVTMTIKRFFGPYDAGNARVAPYGVDRFDASLPVHSLAKLVGRQLKRDWDKFLDSIMVLLGDSAATVTANFGVGDAAVYPTNMHADNDSTVVGDYKLDFNTITRAVQEADERKLPTLADGRRVLIITPQQAQNLVDDKGWQRYAEFHPPANPILKASYIKSIDSVHVFKSQTLTKKSNSSSINIQYGQLWAPGAVGVGFTRLPEVVTSTADNFGEHALVGWATYMAATAFDSRFLISVRSS